MDSFSFLTNVAAVIGFFTLLRTLFSFFYRNFRSHQETKTIEQNKTMASSSLDPSSWPRNEEHHVFPSFHGADVRRSFLSHMLKELRSKAIDLFIDNNIERSKSIGPELIEAIRGSRIAIVLLSKNYASSTWCLDELVEIIRCREVLGQTVMVIFYEVDPTDVKKQTGEFGKVFKKTCRGKTKEEIGRWKQALEEVAKIAGYHSSNWDNETKMIETIAIDVSNKLNSSTISSDFDSLVGMESHMINMGPLLELNLEEVRVIGIWGPPGIGKTTIARFLFNQHSIKFQLSVFMENIKTSYAMPTYSDDYSVKKYLQEQFMSKIINHEGFKIPHLGIIKDRLKDKKVLVVLDDVDRLVQLEAIVKEISWFGRGSRIIITTQDRKILQAHRVNHTYKVDFPSSSEALQMFCMYAFHQKSPKDGFTKLAWVVTKLAGELPLGLKIMGSYFRGMSVQDWTQALPRLRTRLDGEIESILKFSYEALCDEDKNLFLHIACFFNNESVDTLEGCLANSLSIPHVTQGIRVLIEKSLLYVEMEKVNMHELLVQLGREIVRKQSVSEPGKRQFLVDARDIVEVLNDDKVDTSKVMGLSLITSDHDLEVIKCINERAFERSRNLHFLRVYGYGTPMYFPLNLNFISPKLRYLSWYRFPMQYFPSGFQTKFLVKLKMMGSKLEKLWEGIQPLNNLKWMDLCYSENLKELPNLSTATNLCELDLSRCSSLVKLPSSIGNTINLQTLDLRYCTSLVELPTSMKNLRKLSELRLPECSKLEVCLTNINLESLEKLDLSGCSSLKCHPETSANIEDLKPSGIAIKEVSPLMMRSLPLLSELEVSNKKIQELGPWVGRISCLRVLNLSRMQKLVSLPRLPSSLDYLNAEDCESLERLDCSFPNPNIRRLIFPKCFKLNQEARNLIIYTRTNEYAVLPSEEVPACFTYRASGSSLTVKLNQKPIRKSIIFKACVIFASTGRHETVEIHCTIMSKQNALTVCRKVLDEVIPKHLYIFEVEVEEVTSTELLFEFEVSNAKKDYEIKECGVMELWEVP